MSWLKHRSLVVAFLALLTAPTISAQLGPGDRLPELAELGLEGDLPELAGKVVVLDVWASWCAPCKASFPALSALQREFAGRGVVVLGVSVDRAARPYTDFVQRHAPAFPTVRDAAGRLAPVLAPPAMPTTYLIDRQGRVREVHRGFHGDDTLEQWRAVVRQLVEEQP